MQLFFKFLFASYVFCCIIEKEQEDLIKAQTKAEKRINKHRKAFANNTKAASGYTKSLDKLKGEYKDSEKKIEEYGDSLIDTGKKQEESNAEIQNGVKIFNLTGHEDDKRIAMNHMNLEIKEGEWVTIIGGNGSGKSTLMNVISGVHMLDEGHVFIDNEDVKGRDYVMTLIL
jgi:ABC-type bacteriocin/lantibiotic exporter with double-glycine peptidase domain